MKDLVVELKIAELADLDGVLALHRTYQVDTIDAADRADGFVTTPFSREELTELITREQGLFIARTEEWVLAYAMAASWEFWSAWPMFEHMIKELPKARFMGQVLDTKNSCQYGPICVDKSMRGTGLVQEVFDLARREAGKRFPILVTFVNKKNPRSHAAHVRKLKMTVIREFTYNGNEYYELASDATRSIL